MQNPNQGVAKPLQNHVHLISGHRFPNLPTISLEQVVRYLVDAPTIAKSMAPMAWHYVTCPPDGTLWLEWLPPEKMVANARYPSDGYVWGDQEMPYRQSINGYTLEIMDHTIGFRYGLEAMAQHARTRYHLLAKAPNVNAAPPDPSLWLVHYHPADQRRVLPSQQVPIPQAVQISLSERQWLESQGKLERKDFMLHDRSSWPMIYVPSQARAVQRGFGSTPGQRFPPQLVGGTVGPVTKRQRLSQSGELADTNIEDEENTTLGDFFDHLTARDVSLARYLQHHRWIEEVFSSPYASEQIVPMDLGLGLAGELRGLTEGILDPPASVSERERTAEPSEAQPFAISPAQLEEFIGRMQKHLEEGREDLERIKSEHSARMAQWKQPNALMQAAQKLRQAPWRVAAEPSTIKFDMADGSGEPVEQIVEEMETALGARIRPYSNAKLVDRGGLEDDRLMPTLQTVQASELETAPNGPDDPATAMQPAMTLDMNAGLDMDVDTNEFPFDVGLEGDGQFSSAFGNWND